jgi:hypothetical protein
VGAVVIDGRPAYVYSIRDTVQRAVKIGWAYDPERRLRELQCAHARTTLVLAAKVRLDSAWDAQRAERRLHEIYAAERLQGEWFDESILEDAPDADACTTATPSDSCAGGG